MKTVLKNLVIIALATLLFSSCDEFGKTKLKFDTSFDVDLPVVVTPGKSSFSVVDTIDILAHPDLVDYTDQISNIDIQSVTFEIIALNPEPITITNADLSASVPNLPAANWVFTNQMLNMGTIITLDNSNNQLTNTQNIFMAQQPIAVNLSGNISETAATFTVRVTFNSEVTVTVGL
ncbi:MAG: hypothetical protein CVU02_02820 [Bacteroidetes bacterium HGW-Bacteroidetes-19]|nr:MAG: hypothetical protein CVU02_02820 [Bacteroidetes bacterium HGW-Bacteroidetes-19]